MHPLNITPPRPSIPPSSWCIIQLIVSSMPLLQDDVVYDKILVQHSLVHGGLVSNCPHVRWFSSSCVPHVLLCLTLLNMGAKVVTCSNASPQHVFNSITSFHNVLVNPSILNSSIQHSRCMSHGLMLLVLSDLF